MSGFGFFAKVTLKGRMPQPAGRGNVGNVGNVEDKLPRLTRVQARVIRQVAGEVTLRRSFAPRELWPGDSREEYENRCACQELTGMGLIDYQAIGTRQANWAESYVIGPGGRQYRLRLMAAALAALEVFERGEQL